MLLLYCIFFTVMVSIQFPAGRVPVVRAQRVPTERVPSERVQAEQVRSERVQAERVPQEIVSEPEIVPEPEAEIVVNPESFILPQVGRQEQYNQALSLWRNQNYSRWSGAISTETGEDRVIAFLGEALSRGTYRAALDEMMLK